MSEINPHIPKLAQKCLRRFCPGDLYESIEGDLEESFEEDSSKYGINRARWRYTWNVIRFFHPEILVRNQNKIRLMNYSLLYNHTKISWRNLVKGRMYSVINITGLALGMAACLLILSYTQFEGSYDQFHKDNDRLYRVNQTAIWNPEGGTMSSTPPPLAALLKDRYPEIESSMRINTPGGTLLRYRDPKGTVNAYNENEILAVDSNFFDFFQLPLSEGNYQNALTGVNKAVITKQVARKYFGSTSAVGKILEYGEERRPLQVTAVTEDLPQNMHFSFDILISMPTNPNVKTFDWSWIWTQIVTYVKLKEKSKVELVESKLDEIPSLYIKSTFDRLGMDFEDFIGTKGGWKFSLQAVRDIHLKSSSIGNRIGKTVDGSIIRILEILAFLILLVAMINFVNLTTARSTTRFKEIGVKKTMGAYQSTLMSQFLIESILISILSMLVALPLVLGLQSLVTYYADIKIPLDSLFQPRTIFLLAIATISVGVVAGVYPAFYLSRQKIIQVFKGGNFQGSGGSRLRNALVVLQFTVSMALISGTVLIFKQLSFMNTKDLGFNKENIVVINHAEKLGNQLESFRNEVAGYSDITEASISMEIPGRGSWEDIFMTEGSNVKLPISQIKIDDHFFPTLELALVKGRMFDEDRPADNDAVIINETTARLFDWTNDEALGKRILYPGYGSEIRVIGVVNDFHFQSLRQDIAPLLFFSLRSQMWGDMRVVTVKYSTLDHSDLLSKLETSWNRYVDHIPFDYSFYDEELAQLYDEEAQLGHLISLFGGLTLFIAMIGLIGMVTYSVEKRKKEIGIRKVLGASVFQIFVLINSQYIKLGLIALFLSIPLAWNSLNHWLQSFAFRVSLNPVVFILSGILVILLAVISVAYLSVSAASVQPAEVLQDE